MPQLYNFLLPTDYFLLITSLTTNYCLLITIDQQPMNNEIILASGSPRRSEILKQLGVNFRVVVSGEDEKPKPTPVFLPGKTHGQRSLGGYSPWGHKESDTTE